MIQYRLLKNEECQVTSKFWTRYTTLVKEKVIPYQWEILNDKIPDTEPSHAIDNFRIAAGLQKGHFYGEVFQDSDVAKWLEAVGNILLLERDEELEERADSIIDIIADAQEQDGYLDTYFIIEEPDKKWTNVLECHELYCAGHFIEAAVSYYLATGKKKILTIAKRLADCIGGLFGENKKFQGYPGHQEIEIALIRLSDITGEKKYLEIAQYFINTRGTNKFFEQEFEKRKRECFWTKAEVKEPNRWYNQFSYKYYNQFHLPVREQTNAVGHAVRGVYMYTAMADIAARTKEKELFAACKSIWNDIVGRQMYITGGIGTTHSGEAFTVGYDLPNDTNYSETCASIGLIFFAQKMLQTEVDRTYGDTIERALYNTILGGMNYEGTRFFYVNPLEVVPEVCDGNTERNHVKSIRQKWFSCACCPPNIARTIPKLWEYVYTTSEDTVYVHLFLGNEANISTESGELSIKQQTNYPWNGNIVLEVAGKSKNNQTLAIRIPGWSKTYSVEIGNEEINVPLNDNGYIYIERDYSVPVKINIQLDDKPYLIQANQKVHYNAGRTAITKGPLIYCIEEADNGKYLNQLALDPNAELTIEQTDHGLEMPLIKTKGYRIGSFESDKELYQPYKKDVEAVDIKAIPYFLWNNRGPGEMQVWIRVKS